MRLTLAGEAFAAEARLTLFHADRAVQGARAAKGQYRGPWSIGYSPLIDLRILSKVRGHLSSTHPAADVRLVSAHTSEQAARRQSRLSRFARFVEGDYAPVVVLAAVMIVLGAYVFSHNHRYVSNFNINSVMFAFTSSPPALSGR